VWGLVGSIVDRVAEMRGQRSSPRVVAPCLPVPPPTPMPVAPSPVAPPVAQAVVRRGRTNLPYALEVGCGCPLGWPNTFPPEAVDCPRHGRSSVHSIYAAEMRPGRRLTLAAPWSPISTIDSRS
jgi:hypothetical protein